MGPCAFNLPLFQAFTEERVTRVLRATILFRQRTLSSPTGGYIKFSLAAHVSHSRKLPRGERGHVAKIIDFSKKKTFE